MSISALERLAAENDVLRNQLNQLRYFLAGSGALKIHVPDLEIGQSLYCERGDIHQLAAGLLLPAATCIDIGPGLRPQRLLDCRVHVLVEPWRPYVDRLLSTFPEKIVAQESGEEYLGRALDKSVDTVFMFDLIEHLDKDMGRKLLAQALRVARQQVVIFTPMGFMPHEAHDVPASWGAVAHGLTQKHLSGWR